MKVRVVQDGNGKYFVEYRERFSCEWRKIDAKYDEYPNNDGYQYSFDVLTNAQNKMNKFIEKLKLEKLEKKFKVISQETV